MLRIVTFFVVVAVLAIGAGWLADRPGLVTLNWQGYAIELSIMTTVVGLAIFAALAVILHAVYRFIRRSPGLFGNYLKGRRRDKGYEALSQGMIAVGSGDMASARSRAREAAKLLPDEPMTMLLAAQAAQAAGRRDDAIETFNAMLESRETRLLGLRGLFLEAKRDNNADAARLYAREALEAAPSVRWAGTAMFEFQCAGADWDGALKTLQIQTERQVVDKAESRRRRAVLLTAKAMGMESGEPEQAMALALEAHGLAPELVAASTLAARLSARLGNIRRASSVIEKSWRLNPHPELANAYGHVRPGDSVRDRYRRIKALTQKAIHNTESRIARATAAIEAKDWAAARKTLMTLAKTEPTVRVCELMALVEEGEHSDLGRAREWLARAAHALPDPVWTADGMISETWRPVSPVSGQLDAFEWKVPVEAMTPLTKSQIEALAEPVRDRLPEPTVPVPETTTVAVTTGAVSVAKEAEDAEIADAEMKVEPTVEAQMVSANDSGASEKQDEAKSEAPAEAEKSEETADKAEKSDSSSGAQPATDRKPGSDADRIKEKPSDSKVEPIRPPDDPGPDGVGLEEGLADQPKKRFGIF